MSLLLDPVCGDAFGDSAPSIRRQASPARLLAAPRLLFAPYYKWGGTGEFARAVMIARAAQRHWPRAQIEFLLPGGDERRDDCPFPHAFNDEHLHKPARVRFLNGEIARRQPDVVIFDCYSAPEILDQCRRTGARSIYVADQFGTCRRALEWRWLQRLDVHWQQRPDLTRPVLSRGQQLRAALSRTRRSRFDACFDDEEPLGKLSVELERAVAVAGSGRPFALFVPGGGGYRLDGRWVGDVFFDAAERYTATTGNPAIVSLGALHGGPMPAGRAAVVRSLPVPLLIRLMRQARVVVTNGASGSLHQALTCGAACVAAPLGGSDQPGRIDAYAAAGLLQASPPRVDALAEAARALTGAEGERLQTRVRALQLVNGLPMMIDDIATQLALKAGVQPRAARDLRN